MTGLDMDQGRHLNAWQTYLYFARVDFHKKQVRDSKQVAALAANDVNTITDHLNTNPQLISSMDALKARINVLKERGASPDQAFAKAWLELTGTDVNGPWANSPEGA